MPVPNNVNPLCQISEIQSTYCVSCKHFNPFYVNICYRIKCRRLTLSFRLQNHIKKRGIDIKSSTHTDSIYFCPYFDMGVHAVIPLTLY